MCGGEGVVGVGGGGTLCVKLLKSTVHVIVL